MPLLRSESLSGKCAELHTVAASNSRGHKTTLVVTISKYCTINCSLALQALLEITHHDHCIGITLLLLVHATYISVLFLPHIPFVVNRKFNATPTERLQHHLGPCHTYKQKVWHILQAWHIALPEYFSRVNFIKKQAEVLPHSPIATGGGFGGLSSSETTLQVPPNWNIKHYKIVIFVQISDKCKTLLILLKTFWWRFCWHTKLFISHFFGNNG